MTRRKSVGRPQGSRRNVFKARGYPSLVRTLLAPLLGFALFGAIFAAVYYAPEQAERELNPKFRLGPGDIRPDRLWEAAGGENVTVNITVLRGGPIGVFVVDVDNLTEFVLNGTEYGFDIEFLSEHYLEEHSNSNVTDQYNFTLFAPGHRDLFIMYVSNIETPDGYDELSSEEQQDYLTEVAVEIHYTESETKSLVLAYLFAAPSILLVGVAFWHKWRRGDQAQDAPAPQYPRDKDL